MKSLNLTYKGSLGKTHLLKINYVKDGLTKEEITQQMKALADSQLFAKDGEQLYVQPVSAKYVTTNEEVVLNKEDLSAQA
jgi:hypothetical protein